MQNGELLFSSSIEQLQRLDSGEVSSRELVNATFEHIEAVNPTVRALVNLVEPEHALALADQADQARANGQSGALLGLPMAPKDTEDVAGLPTTFGFKPYADKIAQADSPMVARLRAAGAIFIGKSNCPEFALGSHTFNNLFGHTYNPYDLSRTPGGSSGGAAAALASGMLSVADGSDMGGSLRNPASFCNVVGFRPSIGRIPTNPVLGWMGRLATAGPMGRTVAETAHLMAVQAGYHPNDPLSLPGDGSEFAADLATDIAGLRIAYSPDLGGLPIDPDVSAVINSTPGVFQALGCSVDQADPDLTGAMEIFSTQRAAQLALTGRALDRTLPDWRASAKDTAIWNIEQGYKLSAEQITQAEVLRTQLFARTQAFFATYEALILPSAQVPPFDARLDWIREINGVEMATYIDWMTVCCAITVTGHPAISVPAGFTAGGLPIGLQIVGRFNDDLALLKIANAFEQATKHHQRVPTLEGIEAEAKAK